MDQRGHRRRAGHCVTEPCLQWELRGLTTGSDQQEDTDECRLCSGQSRSCSADVIHGDGADIGDHPHHGDQHAHVTDTVHDKRLLRGGRIVGHLVPEADQQV